MEHRKYQNPLSYGLVPIKRGVTTNDYFYREVLLNKAQPNEPKTEMDGEDQIDIDVLSSETNTFGNSKVFESDDEILIKNPAFDCVVDIRYQSEEPLLFKGKGFDISSYFCIMTKKSFVKDKEAFRRFLVLDPFSFL
jgi:hypothetical protein